MINFNIFNVRVAKNGYKILIFISSFLFFQIMVMFKVLCVLTPCSIGIYERQQVSFP
ncbi:Hypothetical protein FNO222_0515 [Francisella orientalis]|uniref:Uncharacterized protein n=1 Tax=Francisella orientalis TaxID=299583 RepID=A0ABN4GYH0_9GAMM|nr:hypothetical protein FNO12_0512 [Francisella orientalis FNO12]AKN86789.1 Hypothetical protein FNO24_0512 [Francisella orientalis FNO24]AKN88328.1 Hypothetical protein FNO190_0512 [Francisella orientalis]AKU05082.1 Hypothetical protein FNO01_0512 [Francisella orientalis]QEN19991.1 Hypothetical protein FNO39_0515 [Francisella orientalis]